VSKPYLLYTRNFNRYLDLYRDLKILIKKKYGKVTREREAWFQDERPTDIKQFVASNPPTGQWAFSTPGKQARLHMEGDTTRWGEAVAWDSLRLETSWESKKTFLMLRCVGGGGSVRVTLSYLSQKHLKPTFDEPYHNLHAEGL